MKFLAFLVFFSLVLRAHAVPLNDLSVLLPLPSENEQTLLLSPSESGNQGQLMPRFAFQRFPQLIFGYHNEEIYQKFLKVVSIRLDPCFQEDFKSPCHRQIRFVWQPIVVVNNQITTLDSALHSFYEFDETQWKQLVTAWKSWSAQNDVLTAFQTDLQIHPTLQRESFSGPSWKKLKSLLLKFCGENNLVRLSGMTLAGREQVWDFVGFDIKNKKLTPIIIPIVKSESQLAVLNIEDLNQYLGGTNPEIKSNSAFYQIIRNSRSFQDSATSEQIESAVSEAFKFENPRMIKTGNLDCVSCHMAQSVRLWTLKSFTPWDWFKNVENQYPNPSWNPNKNLQNFKVNQFRSFGYFENQPVISERVINETMEVQQSPL